MTNQPGFTPPADNDPDDDDDLSISALEPEDGSSWLVASNVGRRLKGTWRASGVVAALALAAIIAVVVAPHVPRPSFTRSQVSYTALAASSDLAQCLSGLSWSPDGQRIAAVASAPCGVPYTAPATLQPNLLIFDAASGRLAATYGLDRAVRGALARLGFVGANGASYDISYYETNWAPTGRMIAVGFGVYGAAVGDSGMALVTLSGANRGRVVVSLNPPDSASGASGNGFAPMPVERWDVVDGSHATIYLAPALTYHWLPSDVLVADEPLPTNASAVAPTMPEPSPTSDVAHVAEQSFSMWRTGMISPVTATQCASEGVTVQPLTQPYALLALTTSAWSPDGRYLLDAFLQLRLPTKVGRPIASFDGSSPRDSGPAPDQLPMAPAHDKGLSAALGLLDAQGGNQLTLAWSPDGRRLAVSNFAIAQDVGSLIVYDCASGATLQRFTGGQFGSNSKQYGATENPIWSPDSSRLLLTVNGVVAKVVILGPAALGA
ncbi:MAG TPA: hypothetical protein VE338_20315 [Ktedonobacterales bacterium]|nr:hypothetical protein [Ktedonobacterales bacterium]